MFRALYIGLAIAICGCSAASEPLVVPAYRTASPPVIDGVINEGTEWKDVPSIKGLVDAATNRKAPDQATIWLAYDKNYIYAAARLADNQPSQIRATQYQTNVSLDGDDSFQLDLDVTGSGREFNVFTVNPKGATNTELAGGRAAKREWAGEFQAAARITSTGWEVEMRIPWRAMKLPASGPRDVRFNCYRSVPRSARTYTLSYQTYGSASLPIWRGVVIPKAPQDRSIKLLPYGYAGYDPSIRGVFDAGLDLKTCLTDRVQLVGSINPDFRNIENSILSLDFSRFARLAGESRPFFLEGSQYIGSGLFASQMIPRFDAGVNTYGKLNDKTSFGILDTVRLGTENDLVATTAYGPDAATTIQASATNVDGRGARNQAYQALVRRSSGSWAATAWDAHSNDGQVGGGDSSWVSLNYRSGGLTSFSSFTRATAHFLPRLAFVPETDYQGYRTSAYYYRPSSRGPWTEAGTGFSYLVFDHVTGGDYRRSTGYNGYGILRNGLYFFANENLDQFEGSNDHTTVLSVGYPFTDPYNNVSSSITWGREAGLVYDSLSLNANRRIDARLQLTGSYQRVAYAGWNDQAIVGFNWDLHKDTSVYGRLVEQGGATNAYLAFRRSGNLGAEYYLIVGDPNAAKFRESVILKVVVPVELGGHR